MRLSWPVPFTRHPLAPNVPWPSRAEWRVLTSTSPVSCFYTVLGKDTYEICNVPDPQAIDATRCNTVTRLPASEDGAREIITQAATTAETDAQILDELLDLHLRLPSLLA